MLKCSRGRNELADNLELIINNEKWNVVILNEVNKRPYWSVNTQTKTLFINKLDVDDTKRSCYIQYTR
jgi:hypothetical protein